MFLGNIFYFRVLFSEFCGLYSYCGLAGRFHEAFLFIKEEDGIPKQKYAKDQGKSCCHIAMSWTWNK